MMCTPTRTRAFLSLPALLLVIGAGGGCVTATVQQVREASTGISDTDAIVVLGRKSRPTSDETEVNFVRCVGDRMGRGSRGMHVISESDFRDAVFPWFEPRTAPANTADLPELMSTPVLARRLQEMGLKYLVWIDGSTVRTDSAGSMTCSVTTAGAGCFGFLTWEHDSSYEATVWDVRSGSAVGRVSADALGTSYVPAVVVPVPLIARVQNSACNSLAQQLKTFIAD
ncbi:MAG: hypothetical protein P8Y69_14535 [Gammaproteobacteria bacterium]|jgi:hypothetical protein